MTKNERRRSLFLATLAAVALLQVMEAIKLVAVLVAVSESFVNIAGEVELNLAVDAVEVHLLGVEVDTLTTKEIKLVLLGVECQLLVLELLHLLVACGFIRLSDRGENLLLLLLDDGRHDLGLLSLGVRVYVVHEVPAGNRCF